MFNSTQVLALIIEEALLLLLVVGTAFTLLIGLFFSFAPSQAIRFSQSMGKWSSLRRHTKTLEQSHRFDPTVYKYHRLFGIFIMFGAIYVLYRLGFNYNQESLVKTLAHSTAQERLVDWLLNAFLWLAVPVMLAILLIGAILTCRPSGLKGIERYSNRWISTRKWLLSLEKQQLWLDNLIHHHPRTFGILVIILSSYSFIALLITYIQYLH